MAKSYSTQGVQFCGNGHEFTKENTYLKLGKYRECRTCVRESGRRYKARRRARTCDTPLIKRPRSFEELWQQITAKCVWINGCFVWQGRLSKGYGLRGWRGKTIRVSRIAYEYAHGPIPDGLMLDHVKARGCWSRACCNVAHLEAVTSRENTLRGSSNPAVNATKTHCKRGHEFTPENTQMKTKNGHQVRRCLECVRNAR